MTYTLFNGALPNGATQNGTGFGQSARDNLNAIRDSCVMGGGFFGWTLTVTNGAGTADAPQFLTYANGTERVRATLTWASGNVTVAVYEYSSNGGADYTTSPGGRIGQRTIAYDSSGNVISTAWSA